MNMQDYTDTEFEELMRLSQKGDKKAYAQLFHGITPLLRAFVARKLNNSEDRDDVVQEILFSIHKASHTYDTSRPFTSWMYAIAHYRLTDRLRTMYRNKEQEHDNYEDKSYALAGNENVTETYETREYLDKALTVLPERQKKIITMMKLEGYTAKETADSMDMSETAVKVSAHRAMKTLAVKAGKDK